MITAVLLRNYKCYENLYFAPICATPHFPYSAYIGPNGVGKSAILESVDAFFDNRDWNINKKAKKDEAFVAPVFLVNKSRINAIGKQRQIIEYISDYFWAVTAAVHPQLKSQQFKEFFSYRDELSSKVNKDDYYFFVIGREYSSKGKPYFSTFNNGLWKGLEEEGFTEDEIKGLFKVIEKNFAYIYLPVEGYVEDVLCLETEEMKELMSKDILDEIDRVLNRKVLNYEDKQLSVVKWINESLNKFMDEINDVIGDVDSDYSFKVDGKYKKNVTAQDIRDRIIDAYFSIRTLKKDRKEVGDLSSGEQRKALVDIAYSFLSQRKDGSKNVILAIDEPEASLNVAACLPQFDRLYDLVGLSGAQVITTTHWYGFLPSMQEGTLSYVEQSGGEVGFTRFEMPSLYDSKRRFPDDIELKSVFDFVSSILSMVRNSERSILIVEGIEDYHYLRSHVDASVKIIPVGGAGNVIKIYKYLFPSFDDEKEVNGIDGKVVCLIDTDNKMVPFGEKADSHKGGLMIRRLQYKNGGIALVRPGKGGEYTQTEIEDAVDGLMYHSVVSILIEEVGDDKEKELLSLYQVREESKYAMMNYEESVFMPIDVDGYRKREELNALLEKYKKEIAKKYYDISSLVGVNGLSWANELVGRENLGSE